MTTNRPHIHKHGNTWRVTIGTHLYAARTTHADAWQFAEGVADYARCIQFKRDLTRTRAAINRMENNART